MKKLVYTCVFAFLFLHLSAQVANRYPLIQSPNETSTVIAWNNATAGIANVKWGLAPNALSNTITEASANQIHGITISGLQPNTKYYYQPLAVVFKAPWNTSIPQNLTALEKWILWYMVIAALITASRTRLRHKWPLSHKTLVWWWVM